MKWSYKKLLLILVVMASHGVIVGASHRKVRFQTKKIKIGRTLRYAQFCMQVINTQRSWALAEDILKQIAGNCTNASTQKRVHELRNDFDSEQEYTGV